MNPMNPLGVIGWACPSCKGWTRCNDDCICPACFKDRHADSFTNSLAQWAAFAPLLHDLNTASVSWGWSTSFDRPTRHSIEIRTDEKGLVEVFRQSGRYVAEFCEYVKEDNYWEVKYDKQATQADEIVSFINQFR